MKADMQYEDSACFSDEDFQDLTNLDDAVRHLGRPIHPTKSRKDYNEDSGFSGGPNLSNAELAVRFMDPSLIEDH